MNGVLGMTGLLLQTRLDGDQMQFARTILRSGETLLTILNDILDFSKIEAGKLDLEVIDFDLVSMLDGTVELMGPQAHAKGLELPTYLAPDVPRNLRGDEGRIRQILLNLINNAIKFTETGGVKVKVELAVSVEEKRENSVTLRFEVTDTGIGVPESFRDRLFDKFTQADGSVTRRYGGAGLGLAICKQLVTLMKGDIGVMSREGNGSTFWFTITLERQSGKQHAWAGSLEQELRGRHILVVDDNEVNRLVFEKQLTVLGAKVTSARNAQSAMSKLQSAAEQGWMFDAAIIDHLMPGTDGLDLGAMIREELKPERLKLVLSSSSGIINTDATAQKHGFDAALPKPMRPGALLKCLGSLFQAEAAPRVSRPAVRPRTKPVSASPEGAAPESAPGEPAAASVQAQPPEPPSAERQPGPVRILVAEDNPINQMLMVTILKCGGYHADVAANGREVLEAVRNLPYDLIVMDIQMPVMGGIEATQRIRRLDGGRARIPIIAATAHALHGDRERFLEAGVDDYVSKPIDRVALLEKIAQLTGRKPDGQPLDAGEMAALKNDLADREARRA